MHNLRVAAFLVLLLITSQPLIVTSSSLLSVNDVSQNLTEAEEAVVEAYAAVVLAEEAGADVSTLLAKLNEAGDYLSKGRQLNSASDLDEAIRLAGEVRSEAIGLKESATSLNLQRIMLTMIVSVVALVLTVIGSILFWSYLKHRYRVSPPAAQQEVKRGII